MREESGLFDSAAQWYWEFPFFLPYFVLSSSLAVLQLASVMSAADIPGITSKQCLGERGLIVFISLSYDWGNLSWKFSWIFVLFVRAASGICSWPNHWWSEWDYHNSHRPGFLNRGLLVLQGRPGRVFQNFVLWNRPMHFRMFSHYKTLNEKYFSVTRKTRKFPTWHFLRAHNRRSLSCLGQLA